MLGSGQGLFKVSLRISRDLGFCPTARPPKGGSLPRGLRRGWVWTVWGRGQGAAAFWARGRRLGLNKPPRLPRPALAVPGSQSDGPPPKCADTAISRGGIQWVVGDSVRPQLCFPGFLLSPLSLSPVTGLLAHMPRVV